MERTTCHFSKSVPKWQRACQRDSEAKEGGQTALFRTDLQAKHAPLAVIFGGGDTCMQKGGGVMQGGEKL